jgi:Ca2+-binding EF-hand superfamily protein
MFDKTFQPPDSDVRNEQDIHNVRKVLLDPRTPDSGSCWAYQEYPMSDSECKRLWRKYDERGWIDQSKLGLLLRDCGIKATRFVLNDFLTEFPSRDGRISFVNFRHYYRATLMKSKGGRGTKVTLRNGVGRARKPRVDLPPDKMVYGRPSVAEKENAASSLRWDHAASIDHGRRGSTRANQAEKPLEKRFQGRREVDWCSKETLQNLIENNSYADVERDEVQRRDGNGSLPGKDAGVTCLFAKVRAHFQSQGVNGIVTLCRLFKEADLDGNNTLEFSEFVAALNEMGLPLSRRELRILFDSLDQDGDNSVDFIEFQNLIQEPLSARRLREVGRTFAALDYDQSGYIDEEELFAMYDAANHPAVIAGIKTQAEAGHEFTAEFVRTVNSADGEGWVSREEFEQYYQTVGAFIESDDQFQKLLRQTWGRAIQEAKGNGQGNGHDERGQRGGQRGGHRDHQRAGGRLMPPNGMSPTARDVRRRLQDPVEGTRIRMGADRTNMARGKARADQYDQRQKADRSRIQKWGTVGGTQRRSYLSSRGS